MHSACTCLRSLADKPCGALGLLTGPRDGIDKPPAFALEERDIWHALSVSAAQQVFGPLRARVDLRLALGCPIHLSSVRLPPPLCAR
jgi:hypothetical protein